MNATRRPALRAWSRTANLQIVAGYLALVAVSTGLLAAYGWALTSLANNGW